ncbi:sensor domain-containing diguanylate cyclase [Bacillus sp. FJAT-49736]|uniref:sensor domain-containing diguanylate cyclase n=1 Tax=Bacillus sp. FJAT-49736 TaxID=2833582 RepID=UPI001BC93BD5|nr:sensor domain-containing diguanylate cyclase [Bacillus sp. FJAT-49736]MBS4171687.1 sensor domain-containing diguanylate cyclase [Bacillus sp. FJAT-49736]
MVEYDGNTNGLQITLDLLRDLNRNHSLVSKSDYLELKGAIQGKSQEGLLDNIYLQLEGIQDQIERLTWLNSHYRILQNFAQICSKTLSEEILLKESYEMVSQVMPTDSFYIAIYNEGDSHIRIAFMIDKGKEYPTVTVEFGDNHTSDAIRARRIIHHRETRVEEEYNVLLGDQEAGVTQSCLYVPVIIDNQVKGVISAQCYEEFAYRKEHEELLQIIGTQVFSSLESVRLYEQIYQISQLDELTGLKNYRAFHDDLTSLLGKSDGMNKLIMIDSDGLKEVNDHYGHDIGDVYLKVLAEGIKSICNDTVEGYRYAGDEFMIIVKSEQVIDSLFVKLMNYYAAHPVTVQGNQIFVSISTGVSSYPKDGTTVDTLKKSADTALYSAKKQGGNQIVFASN